MKRIISLFALLAVVGLLAGCFTPSGLDVKQQQKYAKDMADKSLAELYKFQPDAKDVVKDSSGYVVYNTYVIDYFFLGIENGWGIAYSNKSGEYTYLKDFSVSMGPGLGIGVMRNILVFDNDIDFDEFVNNAWSLNLKADAVARFSDDGNWDIAGEVNMTNGAKVYRIGHRGLIAEAMLDLSRSWKNGSLTD